MKELTRIELDALQKLDILEKEWLPIVIERSYQEAMDQQKYKDMIDMVTKLGVLPIWFEQSTSKIVDEFKTFEEYLQKRPLTMAIQRIKNRCIL